MSNIGEITNIVALLNYLPGFPITNLFIEKS